LEIGYLKLSDGIFTAFAPGVATNNAPRAQSAALYYTIFFDRLVGVHRASRVIFAKAAIKKAAQGAVIERQSVLVDPYEPKGKVLRHFLSDEARS